MMWSLCAAARGHAPCVCVCGAVRCEVIQVQMDVNCLIYDQPQSIKRAAISVTGSISGLLFGVAARGEKNYIQEKRLHNHVVNNFFSLRFAEIWVIYLGQKRCKCNVCLRDDNFATFLYFGWKFKSNDFPFRVNLLNVD